jgi:hypothetical protein
VNTNVRGSSERGLSQQKMLVVRRARIHHRDTEAQRRTEKPN